MPKAVSSILVLVIPLGCTAVLGIDGNYVSDTEDAGRAGNPPSRGGAETGGAETGGSAETGGNSSGGRETGGTASGGVVVDTGGNVATGGASGGTGGEASCSTDGASCPSGQKCCQAQSGPATKFCVDPAPIVGCDASDCAPCAAPPANAIAVCTAGQCDFQCNDHFARNGSACEATGAGGAGGAGGTSGTGGAPTCVRSQCPGCGFAGPFGCCKSNGTCGCIPYVGPCL